MKIEYQSQLGDCSFAFAYDKLMQLAEIVSSPSEIKVNGVIGSDQSYSVYIRSTGIPDEWRFSFTGVDGASELFSEFSSLYENNSALKRVLLQSLLEEYKGLLQQQLDAVEKRFGDLL